MVTVVGSVNVQVVPVTEITTVYVPAIAGVAFVITGLATVDVNPLTPVQAYVALGEPDAKRFIVASIQVGPLLEAVGGEQSTAFMGEEVVPGIGQPLPSKMPGLLPLLNELPETFPVPKI